MGRDSTAIASTIASTVRILIVSAIIIVVGQVIVPMLENQWAWTLPTLNPIKTVLLAIGVGLAFIVGLFLLGEFTSADKERLLRVLPIHRVFQKLGIGRPKNKK